MILTLMPFTAYADSDTQPPQFDLSSIKAEISDGKSYAVAGDTVRISVKITDESAITYYNVTLVPPDGNGFTREMTYDSANDEYYYDYTVTDESQAGIWKINQFYATDEHGNGNSCRNKEYYSGEGEDLSICNFNVATDGWTDKIDISVNGVKVADPTAPIIVPATGGVFVTFDADYRNSDHGLAPFVGFSDGYEGGTLSSVGFGAESDVASAFGLNIANDPTGCYITAGTVKGGGTGTLEYYTYLVDGEFSWDTWDWSAPKATIDSVTVQVERAFTVQPESKVIPLGGGDTAQINWETNFEPTALKIFNPYNGFEIPLSADATSYDMPSHAYCVVRAYYGSGENDYIDSDEFSVVKDFTPTALPDKTLTYGKTKGEFVGKISTGLTNADGNTVKVQMTGTNLVNVNDPKNVIPMTLVASIENVPYFTVGGKKIVYNEDTDYGISAFTTVAGDKEFVYVDGYGTDAEFSAVASVLAGRIAICNRGGISFVEKYENAAGYGAIGLLVVNYDDNDVSMNLSGSSVTIPAAVLRKSDGDIIKNSGTYVSAGTPYYKGKITVSSAEQTTIRTSPYNGEFYIYYEGQAFESNVYAYVADWSKAVPGATYKATISYKYINGDDYSIEIEKPVSSKTTLTLTVPKAENTLTAKSKTVKLKAATLKKKKLTVKRKKAITVKNAKGRVTYKLAKKNKKFTVAKNGNITVKKGTRAGTYKVKIKVTAAGNASYKAATKTVTVKIVVNKK